MILSQKKIATITSAIIAVFVWAIPVSANSDVLPAMRLMVNQNYSGATAQIRTILRNEPQNTDALYALVAIEQTRLLDYESYTIEGRRFQTLADSVLKILEAVEPSLSGDDLTQNLFYRASILGGLGVVQAKRGAWFDAARSGMAAQNLYRQVKRADPNHYGADLGLGLFDYYFGTAMRHVPFVASGNAERGLAQLTRALNAPFPLDHAAKSSLCWILIDRKEFAKADSLARSALARVPTSTTFMRIRAHIAHWTGRHADAISISNEWLARSKSRTPANWSDIMSAYNIIAASHNSLGNRDEARRVANEALALPIPEAHTKIPHTREHMKNLRALAR